MTSERLVRMNRRELELFRLGSGDDNPVHSYRDLTTESNSGKTLVYGGLVVLRGLTDILRPVLPSAVRVSFVFVGRIYVGDGVLIRTFAADGNYEVRIISTVDERLLAVGQVLLCSRANSTLGQEPNDICEADKRARTYRPSMAALQAIRSEFELDATMANDALLASIGLSSYVLGVEITTFGALYGIDIECCQDPIGISSLQYTTSLEPSQNGGAIIKVDIQAEGVAVARAKLRTHPTKR